MEEYRDSDSNEMDEIIDEVNEYPQLFDYITVCGLSTENDLKFDGNVESAKQYEVNQAASALLDMYNTLDSNIDLNSAVDTREMEDAGNFIDRSELKDNFQTSFSLPLYSPPATHGHLTTFQQAHEPRIKYLLRSVKLWQEFANSGDLDKLQVLFNDILTEDCLSINNNSIPAIVGRQKIFEQRVSLNRNIPDFCVLYNNVTRPKKRVITFKGNSFGTLPYTHVNDKSTMTWNIFEYAPIEKLDEYHKIQKQKYDTLKSQNKIIKFERRGTWFLLLSRDSKYISKIMATNTKVEVF